MAGIDLRGSSSSGSAASIPVQSAAPSSPTIGQVWVDTSASSALAVPAQVGTVTPTASNQQVALSWAAPADNGAPITDYIVQYGTDNATWTTVTDGIGIATSVTVASLTNATLYYFRVAAVNAVGIGAYSVSVSATPNVSTLAADTFTRANSTTSLGTADQGGAWSALSGTWGITSNAAYSVTATDGNLAVLDSTATDVAVTAAVTQSGTDASPGLVVRCQDASNYYTALLNGSTHVGVIYKVIAGVATQLGSSASGLTANAAFTLYVKGTTLKLQQSGVDKITVTDSSLTTGTKVGIRYGQNATTQTWDNFQAVTT